MELTSFGAVMKFAIDRENDIKNILELAVKSKNLSSIRDHLTTLAQQNTNNIKTLERTRRENINEVVLHPISGLDDKNYLFTTQITDEISKENFLNLLSEISDILSNFYNEAGSKLHTDDAKCVFIRLAKKRYFEKE